jgi:hypothetical protein
MLAAASSFDRYSALVRSILVVVEPSAQTGILHWGVAQSFPNVIVRNSTPFTLSPAALLINRKVSIGAGARNELAASSRIPRSHWHFAYQLEAFEA